VGRYAGNDPEGRRVGIGGDIVDHSHLDGQHAER
jgi:hypothetical protein